MFDDEEIPPPTLEEQVSEVHKEIVESRNLTIKTDNLIKNLSSDIRGITKRLEMSEKRLVFNSIGAYALFSIVIFTTLYLVFQSQLGSEEVIIEAAKERITELETRVESLEQDLNTRNKAETEVYELVRLMEKGKNDEVLQLYPEMKGNIVNRGESELLRDAVDRINKKIALDAYNYGRDRFERGDHVRARDALAKSLSHVSQTHYTPRLRYYLGRTLFKLKDYAGAVENLRIALRTKHDRATSNEAVFHLAEALKKLGRHGEARRAYGYYAQTFPWDKRVREVAVERIREYIREGISSSGPPVVPEE